MFTICREPDTYRPEIFGPLVNAFRMEMQKQNGTCKLLSACVWGSGGDDHNPNNTWSGINKPGLLSNGSQLDWINIMAYDSGPPSGYNALAAFDNYRKIYPTGHINMGIELGPQGWGGYIIDAGEITNRALHVAKDGNGGIVIWAYNKDTTGSPSFTDTKALVQKAFGTVPTPPAPQPAHPTTTATITCPNCKVNVLGKFTF